jgi:regulation of enolase protein 1 (concanavalin A-like superfamily)
MKINSSLKLIGGAFVFAVASTFGVWAGSITNNFTVPFDFTTNGVVGTMWDGIYLGQGDVPNSAQNGANKGGRTIRANTTQFGNSLYVTTTFGGWENNQDDGFFLYKYVAGDFDVSVEILATTGFEFQAQNYHFAGLLARATPFPQGLPYTPGATNNNESFLNMNRYQEFGTGDSARNTSNGVLTAADTLNFPGDNGDTNTTRFLRIVRTGNTFTFYDKTNSTDGWAQKGTRVRPDLAGVIMQVGIQDAVFTGNQPFAWFTDFELSGANVTDPATLTPPTDPTGVTFSNPQTDGHMTITWAPGAGSAGSLVLLRNGTNAPVSQVPPYGYSFVGTSDTNFQSSSNSFGGTGYRLMYVGSGNTVTVSGLGGSNNTYSALVFSYSGSGSTTTYGVNPATASVLGPGILTSVTFALNTTNVPLGGLSGATVHASYSSGDTYDVSASPTTIWTSSDPTLALATNGTVNGLAIGTAITIMATYGGVTGTGTVNVSLPAFADNFNVSHDFVSQGLSGSMWDGLYIQPGDVPNQNNGGAPMFVTTNDINISSNNLLSVRAGGTRWQDAQNNGYFLFKNVPGDFQVAVHVSNIVHGAYQFAGLMARAAATDGSAFNGSENHVNWWFFDQYTVITSARPCVNGVSTIIDQGGVVPVNNMWLLLQRVNGTNFYCYQKKNPTDPWTFMPGATMVMPAFTSGVPLQVGLAQSTFTPGPDELVQFDNFMLDAANIDTNNANVNPPPPATSFALVSNPNLTMTLNWVSADALGNPLQSMVLMRAGAPVNAAPEYGFLFTGGNTGTPPTNAVFGQPPGTIVGNGNYCVFRSANPPASTNNTVTVSGLSPGTVYYAAVFTFRGTGGGKIFNSTSAPGVGVLNGTLLGLQTSPPAVTNPIPAGGVQTGWVNYGVFAGPTLVPITAFVGASGDDPTIAAGTNGTVTGFAPGSTMIHFSYQGFTNTFPVTVRASSFTENFSVNHDYLNNGVAGSTWDGVYLGGAAGFPFQVTGTYPGLILDADANTTLPNSLTVTSRNTDWAGANDDGFFLFTNVAGDFQVSVHITSLQKSNYLFAGLMVRAYSTNGAPSLIGTVNRENWVYLGEFDEFSDDVESRFALDGGDNERAGFPGTNDFWMLIKRQNGTNFSFFKKVGATDPYRPLTTQNFAQRRLTAATPVQVGIFAATYNDPTPGPLTVQFDSFSLDLEGGLGLKAFLQGGNLIVEWPTVDPEATLLSTSDLDAPNWQPVGASLNHTGDGQTYVTLSPGADHAFFRLSQ